MNLTFTEAYLSSTAGSVIPSSALPHLYAFSTVGTFPSSFSTKITDFPFKYLLITLSLPDS